MTATAKLRLKAMALTLFVAMISELEDVPDNPKKEPDTVAKQWIAAHPELVNQWTQGIQ
jgi:ABC-type proline/glycine betaine transport system substrate-binding protein